MKRVITEPQAMLDLRHLANEIYPLLRGLEIDLRLATELAETAWKKIKDCGPVYDGFTTYFRALCDLQVECLSYDELGCTAPTRVVTVTDAGAWPIWLCLQSAEACSERRYAEAKKQCDLAAQRPALNEAAEQRWAEAEQQLLAEGLLPVRVLAPPSNAGGARYEFEVLVGHELVAGLREALAYWGGYIIAHRPDINHLGQELPARYYTLSVQSVDDVFPIGKRMVLEYFADRAERGQS